MSKAYAKVHESAALQAASLPQQANGYAASADQLRAARRWYGDMSLIVVVRPYPKLLP